MTKRFAVKMLVLVAALLLVVSAEHASALDFVTACTIEVSEDRANL